MTYNLATNPMYQRQCVLGQQWKQFRILREMEVMSLPA